MMNREARRAYQKRIKKYRNSCICPKCGHLSLFYAEAREEQTTAIVCECCGETVRQDKIVAKYLVPSTYVPFTLSDFEKYVEIAEEMAKKEEVKNEHEGE